MCSNFKYDDELNKLIDSEDNFEFFRDLIIKQMSYDFESIKNVLDILLEFSKENGLESTMAWTLYYLGWYYSDLCEYDKALDNFLISNDIFEKIGYQKGLIYACNGLTNIYCLVGQFTLANEWGLKGILLAEETDDKDALVLLLINTGINNIQMRNFSMAKNIFKNIEMMDWKLSKSQEVAYNLSLAEIEIYIGNPKTAIDYIEVASGLENDFQINSNASEIFKLKGMAYVKLHEYDIAEKEFMKCYDLSNKQGYNYEKCRAIIEFSKLCIITGRGSVAINSLEKSVSISKSGKFDILLKESYYILYEVYKKLYDSEKALMYLEEYIKIDDKIYDYEQNQLMAKMNIKHTKMEADIYKLLYDKTELISAIGQKIISNLDIQSIIDIINKEINKLITTDIFGLAIYDSEKGEAIYNFVNECSELKNVIKFNIDDNFALGAYCIKNKEDIIIGNLSNEYIKYTNSYRQYVAFQKEPLEKSMIYTPLVINDKVLGILTVQSYTENAFDKNDLNTLKILASYTAIAVENAMSYKKIEEIALYDNMTGFLTKFEIIRLGELIYKKHMDDNKPFSVIMIDIDNFKTINDTYGHVYGDEAINMITDTISQCIRTSDYIGRYGGDEFLLICPGAAQAEAIDVAERIRNTISDKTFFLGDNIVANITISLGVYEFDEIDMSFIDGVKEADKYLYYAKEGSKNKVVYKSKVNKL